MISANPEWPWGSLDHDESKVPLPDGKIVRLQRDGNLIRSRISETEGSDDMTPEELTIISGDDALSYVPILPERSVVLRSEHILRIAPQNTLKTIVPIPLIPTVSRRNRKGSYETLIQLPISSLSKTWFGDPVSGEPAFALSSPLDEAGRIQDFGPWAAACPLVIINASPEILEFERLILRIPLLSLYLGNNRYYTNRLMVRFRGHDQASQIQIGSSAPEVDEELTLFAGPMSKKDKLHLRKSFSFIKSLAYG